ncbi:MAG: M23 family metallopeptidase [Treponema sp.]|nr:M23 family metallopeptidase [Treponema sp.]
MPDRSHRRGLSIFSGKKDHAPLLARRARSFFFLPPRRKIFARRAFFFLLAAGFGVFPLAAQNPSPLPVISRLDNRDAMFRQYMQDVEASRRLLFSSRQNQNAAILTDQVASSLTIFAYLPVEGDDIFSVAARSNIPLATLASLNRFSNREDLIPGRMMLLPSVPGIFVSETPANSLERLIYAARAEDGGTRGVLLSIPREGRTERFLFIPGDDFTPTERIFFLNRGWQFPLRDFRVTSLYGPRVNPVTGQHGVHRGIDLAAPYGTEVFAARAGTVVAQGHDSILGNYIILGHDNNWISIYGHLSHIGTVLRQEVQSGTLIGRVGSTGQSTGPHLHFELHQHGQTRDPARLLGIFRRTSG